jgi:hypothetical protein
MLHISVYKNPLFSQSPVGNGDKVLWLCEADVLSEEDTMCERVYLQNSKSVFYNKKEGGISMPPSYF